jgi:hypothetical protein
LNHVRFVVIDIFTIQVVLEQGSNTLWNTDVQSHIYTNLHTCTHSKHIYGKDEQFDDQCFVLLLQTAYTHTHTYTHIHTHTLRLWLRCVTYVHRWCMLRWKDRWPTSASCAMSGV